MLKIKDILINNPVIVGPMAGVSNQAFRKLIATFSPGLIYTEMVSDKAIVYKNQKTLEMCKVDHDEGVVSLQLFGEEIDSMVKAAKYMDTQTNCAIIDINMGCPVPKVVKHNGGASLMKDPDYAAELVYAIKKNIQKPLTVKIRTGWTEHQKNAVEMAKKLEAAGCDALAIHGRTKAQMYSGSVDLDMIAQVKAALTIPVFGNGDIRTGQDAVMMMQQTQVDGIMIARGVWGNPWIIEEVKAALSNKPYQQPSATQRFKIAKEHAKMLVAQKGEVVGIREMRSHAVMYIKGLRNSHQVKTKLSQCETLAEFIQICDAYQLALEQELL